MGGHRDGVRGPDDSEAREVGDRSLVSGFEVCEPWEGPCAFSWRKRQDWMGFCKDFSLLTLIGGASTEVISPPKK